MEQDNLLFGFDPTVGVALQQELKHCSIGKAPSGFSKIHTEMMPTDVIKMVGYDPRTIPPSPHTGYRDPAHISEDLLFLIRSNVQRSISAEKVDSMVQYLYTALSEGSYADWAELDMVTAAKPDMSKWADAGIVMFPTSAEYFITDGQHRFCALMDFVRRYPDYANKFTQAVVISILPQDRLGEWGGQSFHDKNYLHTPVKVTKALSVDIRDLHNRLAKELRNHPVIKNGGGVNETKDSLSSTANEFATHAALYRFTRGFCEGRPGLDKPAIKNPRLTEITYQALKSQLFEWVSELNDAFPYWTKKPGREEYLFRSSAALQALGVIGHLFYTRVGDPITRKAMISRIGEANINWRRTNVQDWESVIGVMETKTEDGQTLQWITPRASRQAIDGTLKLLRDRSGFSVYLQAKDQGDRAVIPPAEHAIAR